MPTIRIDALLDQSAGAPNSCWNWVGAMRTDGYGQAKIGPRMCYPHRRAYERTHGPIPGGMFICHRCDNKRCVNPAHLFLGTPADNTNDMIAKDRQVVVVGEALPQAVLTEAQVDVIRAATGRQRDIAAQYGISQSQVSRIKGGRRWNHITMDLPAELLARIREHGEALGAQGDRSCALALIEYGIAQRQARSAGAAARVSRQTPERRSAIARQAVVAREARRIRICRQCENEYRQGRSDARSPEYWCSRDCEQGGT